MKLKDIVNLISVKTTIGVIEYVICSNNMDNIMFRNLIMQLEQNKLMTIDIKFRYIFLRDVLGFMGNEIDRLTKVI
jgi:hypothetical protein